MPIVVIWSCLRARYPSMPSVIAAAMNSADASNSFAPFALLKWELERIQISKGMLRMRLSVMELGRFTETDGFRLARPEIWVDYPPPERGTQCMDCATQTTP